MCCFSVLLLGQDTNWVFLPDPTQNTDLLKTGISQSQGYKIIRSYGTTQKYGPWCFQTTWRGNFWDYYWPSPDTLVVDFKIITKTSSLTKLYVYFATQDSLQYYDSGLGKMVSLDNQEWQEVKMPYSKDYVHNLGKIYIILSLIGTDSCYIGVEIKVRNLRGIYNNPPKIIVYDTFGYITGIPGEERIPDGFTLYQNYPNPFNPSTNISFDLPKESNVTLKVYNILGEEVATLVNTVMPAGHQVVEFNTSNLASGMYVYRLQAGSFVQTKKMLLMK